MKRLRYIFLLLAAGLFGSCHEYEMIRYGEGGQINFMGDYYLGERETPFWQDDTSYMHYEVNFGINPLGDSLLMDTVIIGVKISGTPSEHPRRVVFKTESKEENTLEVIFPEEYYVPADTGMAEFKILLKRPDIKNEIYTANLTFDYESSDFKEGTIERQYFRLKAENTVNLELWGSYTEEWEYYYSMYFGDYSETKARYLITKYGATNLMEWTMTNEFYDLYLTNGFYIDFENYKSNPNNSPLIDEQTGEWIEFPDLAW